jgi:hypothetical protein
VRDGSDRCCVVEHGFCLMSHVSRGSWMSPGLLPCMCTRRSYKDVNDADRRKDMVWEACILLSSEAWGVHCLCAIPGTIGTAILCVCG